MGKSKRLTILTACATVVAAGWIEANMAFRINYNLYSTGGGSASGKNTLALPYVRVTGLNTAENLGAALGGRTVCGSVSRFIEASNSWCVYIPQPRVGGTPCQNFPLTPGEGLFLTMFQPRTYLIAGTHDPSVSITLNAATPGVSSGKNFVAMPYNMGARNALEVMQDIGGGSIDAVQSIARFNRQSDSFSVYTGRMGTPAANFAIVPGEAYFIMMNVTVPWTPSHY